MAVKAHGQLRRSQVITTYGPGALIDLPRSSAIVGGLNHWPKRDSLEQIVEPRLCRKIAAITRVVAPMLYAPPVATWAPGIASPGIGVLLFPEWFIVQDEGSGGDRPQSRRLVHRQKLDARGRVDGRRVVATRFVRACPKGHVDELNWNMFVHRGSTDCRGQLYIDERGTSGDLIDLVVRCDCGKERGLYEATQHEDQPLGRCGGRRPWLSADSREECSESARLLIRTASNAYFPQLVSVLSLPERTSAVERAVGEHWNRLERIHDITKLQNARELIVEVGHALVDFDDATVMAAIDARRNAIDRNADLPVKHVELDAILAVPEGFGDDVPIDENFHARRLPEQAWRSGPRFDAIEAVYQVHRLREVIALIGFTRFEPIIPDPDGEYRGDVSPAQIDEEPQWFPAIENRGEGIFVQLRASAVASWLARQPVAARIDQLGRGHEEWAKRRKSKRDFVGGPYVLLHTLAHLLIQSLSMRCGYPASSIRERIYTNKDKAQYGLLLYTGSPDAEGTLGGLVQEARHIERHLDAALEMARLCSNDPTCANHAPGPGPEGRMLHGAACHGCTLIAETSCEMRNEYLDRALVVDVPGESAAAFFGNGA